MRYPDGDPVALHDFKARMHIRKTDDATKCGNPECGRLSPTPHVHPACSAGDSNICDCSDVERKELHGKILAYINQLESLHSRLTVSFGVTQQLREQTAGVTRPVDQSVPCKDMRSELENMSNIINELSLEDQK